jgi:hypothetical protein
MSDKDKWLGIVESVAGMNIGGRQKGPSRSRRRNQALLGVVGSLWKNYEIDQLDQQVDTDNIQNMFETARAHKDLIKAKKTNKISSDLKALAPAGTDFNNIQDIENVYGEAAWHRTLRTSPQMQQYMDANPNDKNYVSKPAFDRYVNQLTAGEEGEASRLKKLQTSFENLYKSDLRSVQSKILGGEAATVDEVEPFLNQARQMKIKFDGSESSLLDILSGRARRNIARQDQTFDQFRTEFITQPQMEARKAIAAIAQANPNNKKEMQAAIDGAPRNLRIGIAPEIISVINNSKFKKDFYNTLGAIAEAEPNMDSDEFNSIVSNMVLGVATADPNEAQYYIGSIREQLKDSLSPENYKYIMPELYKLAISSSTGLSAVTSRAQTYLGDRTKRAEQQAINSELLTRLEDEVEKLYGKDKGSKNYLASIRAVKNFQYLNNQTSESINFGVITDKIIALSENLTIEDGTGSDFREAMRLVDGLNFKTLPEVIDYVNANTQNVSKRDRLVTALTATAASTPSLFEGYNIYPGNPENTKIDPVQAIQVFNSTADITEDFQKNLKNVERGSNPKKTQQKLGYFLGHTTSLLTQDKFNDILGGNATKALMNEFIVDYLSKSENFFVDPNTEEPVILQGDERVSKAYNSWLKNENPVTAGGITVIGNNAVFNADTTKALNSNKTPTGIMESFNNWQATSDNKLQQSTVSTLIRDFIEENNPKLDFDKTFEITAQGQLKFAEGYNPPTSIPNPETTKTTETTETTVNVGEQVEYTSSFGKNIKRTTPQNTFTLKVDGNEVDVDFNFKGGRDAEGQRAQTLLFADIPESKAKNSLQEKADQYYANIQKMRNLNLSEKDIFSRDVSLGIGKEARALKLANQRLLSKVDLPGIFDDKDVISLFSQSQPDKPELVEAVEDLSSSEKPVEVDKPSLLSKGSDTTRGLKNQNVFNIRDFDQNFSGETGVDEDNFLQFESVELGVRAADRTLKTYGKKHKINTVTGVIERFAPISDNNDTASYIAAVAKQSGFKPEEKIDLSDPQVRAKLLAPMALIESKYKITPEKILTMLENT